MWNAARAIGLLATGLAAVLSACSGGGTETNVSPSPSEEAASVSIVKTMPNLMDGACGRATILEMTAGSAFVTSEEVSVVVTDASGQKLRDATTSFESIPPGASDDASANWVLCATGEPVTITVYSSTGEQLAQTSEQLKDTSL